ncbi:MULTISPECIES: LysR family transcriptional regulator [Hyphomicrobiales]|uniref:LysR family transcriptional regulator n=2 Tax=Hyphomicrobiales TaxID=356 RepID=A0A6L3Y2N7_9HYPH|nr:MULTISPECIES: LysR family transcriptional regulator [Hyphomicrobiales]KAB2674086.1 LysR family transcriptional regulator [Brucella tritici]MBO0130482.1 LysR family transcriptional regulator [Agrobacterium burrii]
MVALVQALAVAEYLSFHRAALALGISQSSVSARIKALEEDLGVILFDRNTRGVRLTTAGRRFVEQVQSAMGILDRAINTAAMQPDGGEGKLRISIHALTPGGFLDRLLKNYREKNPGVRLQIVEGTARDAQFMVREGELDIAFMACHYEIPDLNSRMIWRDRLMVALPTQHRLADQSDVEWPQLAEEVFLVRQGGTGPQINDLIVTRSAGRWMTPVIFHVDVCHSTLMPMIAGGHGISLCVEENVASAPPNVVFLPIRDEPETITFSAVWSPRNRDPALLKLLQMVTDKNRI